MVYFKVSASQGKVWVGDLEKTNEVTKGSYEFSLRNLQGPLLENQDITTLTGKSPPQNPIFLGETNEPKKKKSSASSAKVNELIDILNDIENKTEIELLILARLGQGKFRTDVLKIWDNACAVTGITNLATIRASHIKPWSTKKDRSNSRRVV